MYVCMFVCLSVTGLQLKYTGLGIVYVPLTHAAHDAIAMGVMLRFRTRRIEDDARTSPET